MSLSSLNDTSRLSAMLANLQYERFRRGTENRLAFREQERHGSRAAPTTLRTPSKLGPDILICFGSPAPAAGNGRLQRQLRRASPAIPFVPRPSFTVWAYPRLRARRAHLDRARRYSIYRILRVIAEPVGRAPTIGRPWLWRLRDPAVQKPSEN
jgi:hypothetical protein